MAKKNKKLARKPQPIEEDTPELQRARALWIRRRFAQSLKAFEEAVRRQPRNILALTDAARAFGDRYEFPRAERLLERLESLAGRRARLWQLAGQSYRMIQRPDKAIDCLRRTVEYSPDNFEARLELALLLERRHALDDALEQTNACRSLRPSSAEAMCLEGRLLRRQGDLGQAAALLQKTADSGQAHPIARAQAFHELGQLYDEAGDFEQAYAVVRAGKALQDQDSAEVRRHSRQENKRLESLLDSLGPSDFVSWRNQAADWQQQQVAMLTGPPRSGTTLLERVLDAHPEVVSSDEQMAFPKYILPSLLLHAPADTPLNASHLHAIETERLQEERARYLEYLEHARREGFEGRMHVDKNPSLVMLIPGMLRLFPECKLLIALRDPRDVIVSCYMRYLPLNTVSVQFLTPEGVAKRNTRDMRAWLKLRDMIGSPWLEVRYEDTVRDLPGVARRTIEFLGRTFDDSVLDYRERISQRQVNSPTYEAVLKPIYHSAVGRWKNYEPFLGEAFDAISPLVESLGYSL